MGGVVAKMLGVKRVCWGLHHANLAADAVKGVTGVIARLCGFLSYYIPNVIVSCSQEAVRVHTEFAGYDAQKFIVIPNGVDLTNFTPDVAARNRVRETMSVQTDDFVVGMVARFDPQKDHANLLAAVGLLKKQGQYLHCVLVGTGMDSSNQALMGTLIKEDVLDRVILLGRRDDIPALMNAMDVHALSSYSEALPNVLMEAMACGTLCISTSVGDAPMIVGENGRVVPARNPEAFAKSLLAAKQMYETQLMQWQEKQIHARQRMLENFSIEQMRTSYAAAWKV
jgi:glycosyltransferase involved in cell wall biosynthesis